MLDLQTPRAWLRALRYTPWGIACGALSDRLGVLFEALSGRVSSALRALAAIAQRIKVRLGGSHDRRL